MSVLTILQEERALLSDPARWCQGAYARTSAGAPCEISSRNAVSFCLAGGRDPSWRHSMRNREQAGDYLLVAAARAGWRRVSEANDGSDHAGVLAILDAAIALARATERPATKGSAS